MRTLPLLTLLLTIACVSSRDAGLAREADRLASQPAFSGEVLLAKNGRILHHKSYGTPAATYDIASLGKMFTGVAVAQLEQKGLLAYDAPVARYVPQFPHETVTVSHLLTHRSGIPDLPEDLFRNPPPRLAGYLPFLTAAKLEFTPGEKREYSNSGFVLLGLAIEAVTGTTYGEYIRENVIAGISGGGPHGGARTTARELLRFLDDVRTGKLPMKSGHGFGELAFDNGDRLVGHSGGDTGVSADAYTYLKSGYTIVVLSNRDAPASHDVARGIRKALEDHGSQTPQGR